MCDVRGPANTDSQEYSCADMIQDYNDSDGEYG